MCGEGMSATILVSEEGLLYMELEGELQKLVVDNSESDISYEEQKSMKLLGHLYIAEPWGSLVEEDDPLYYEEEDGRLVYNDVD